MCHRSFKYRWLALVAILCFIGIDVQAQACGYSINTFYVVADDGTPISDVKIEAVRSDTYGPEFKGHFKQATKVFWEKDRNAYVISHGLCGSHGGVVLKFSAASFEVTEQKLDMPLGFQGFVLKLNKKGSKESVNLTAISCSEEPTRCFMRIDLQK